jgi:hypothetical protein
MTALANATDNGVDACAASLPNVLRICLYGLSIEMTSENQRRLRSKIGRAGTPGAMSEYTQAVGLVGTPT